VRPLRKLFPKRPRIITNSEFNSLLKAIDDISFKAAFAILYERGTRVGTAHARSRHGLLGLNWSDIDFEKCTMNICLTSGKVQTLPLGELSEKYLRQLKGSGNKEKTSSTKPVFSSSKKRMSYSQFYHKLKRYMKCAGIPKEKRCPHAFRYSCAVRLVEEHGVYTAHLVLGYSSVRSFVSEFQIAIARALLMKRLRPDKAT
jgi:integrase